MVHVIMIHFSVLVPGFKIHFGNVYVGYYSSIILSSIRSPSRLDIYDCNDCCWFLCHYCYFQTRRRCKPMSHQTWPWVYNIFIAYNSYTMSHGNYFSAAQACHFDGDQVCEVHAFTWTKETIYALPTLLFSFECHGTMLPIYCDLRRKEPITTILRPKIS